MNEVRSQKGKQIFKFLIDLREILGANVTQDRLILYTEKLVDFEIPDIKNAIEKCAMELKFFPALKEIIDFVRCPVSSQDQAEEIVAAIFEAMHDFGGYRGEEAKTFLGPLAWRVAASYGGWRILCTSDEDLGTIRAQLGRHAKALLNNVSRNEKSLIYEWQKENYQIASEHNSGIKSKMIGNVFEEQSLSM